MVIVGASIVAGWAISARFRDGPRVLLSSDSEVYSEPIWVADGSVYFLATGVDSRSKPSLAHLAPGATNPRYLPVDLAFCPNGDGYLAATFPISDTQLGLVAYCAGANDSQAAIVGYDIETGAAQVLRNFQFEGGDVAWMPARSVGFGRSASCLPTGDLAEFTQSGRTCVNDVANELPVLAADADGVLLFFGKRCGTRLAVLDRFLLCSRSVDGAVDVVADGFTQPSSLAVSASSGRIAMSAIVDGQRGLWMLGEGGKLRLMRKGAFDDIAFSSDSGSIVATVISDRWLFDDYKLVVIEP